MINLCGGIHDSLALGHRSKAGQRNVTKELETGVFCWFGLSFVLCVMIVAKYQFVGGIPHGSAGDGASDVWEKTVTVCVTPGGQLSRSGSSMLTPN